MQHEASEQQAPPLQQGIAQQDDPAFLAWIMKRLADAWVPFALEAFFLAAEQHGASQHAILQQLVLHFDESQHPEGAAMADADRPTAANTRLATMNCFIGFPFNLDL